MKYHAFISYSRSKDEKLSASLQNALIRYTKPWYQSRAMRVFRDDASLPASNSLWTSIRDGLDHSRYFILLASPEAAQSKWVSREIKYWIDQSPDHKSHILIVLTSGNIHWDRHNEDFNWEKTDAIPRCLEKKFKDEPNFIDLSWVKSKKQSSIRHARFENKIASLVAEIRGEDKDDMFGEHIRQHRRTLRIVIATSIILAMAAFIAVFMAIRAIDQSKIADHERQLAFARFLGSQSDILTSSDSGISHLRGTLLAIESALRLKTPSSHSALTRSLRLLPRKRYRLPQNYSAYDITSNQKGNRILTASGNSSGHYLRMWDLTTGEEILKLQHDAKIEDMAITHEGKRVATVTTQHNPKFRGFGLHYGEWGLNNLEKMIRIEDKQSFFPAAIGADGRLLAARRRESYIGVWNTVNETQLCELNHDYNVRDVSLSPKKDRMVIIDDRSATMLFDIPSGRKLKQFYTKSNSYRSAVFSPTGKHLLFLFNNGYSGTVVHIHDTETGEQIKKIGPVYNLTLSPVHDLLAAINGKNMVCIFDLNTGRIILKLDPDTFGHVYAFNYHGSRFAVGNDKDGTIRVWDIISGRELYRISQMEKIRAIAFSKCGQYLGISSNDGIHVWDLNAQESILSNADENVQRLLFSPDSKRIASISKRDVISVQDIENHKELKLRFPKNKIDDIRFSTSGEYLFLSIDHSGIWRWDLETDRRRPVLPHDLFHIKDKDTSLDGKIAVVAGYKDAIRVWDVSKQVPVADLIIPSNFLHIAVSIDGLHIAAGSQEGEALIWDLATKRKPLRLKHNGPVQALVFNQKGDRLVTGSFDGTSCIWNVATGEEIARFIHPSQVRKIAIDNFCNRISTVDNNNIMRIWDVESRSELVSIFLGNHTPKGITFNPSGDMIATASEDNTARIWDVNNGKELYRIVHNDVVEKAIFLPKGNGLVTASEDSIVGVWQLDPWSQITMQLDHEDDINDLAFNSDGKYLITASKDKSVRIWNMEAGHEIDRLAHNGTIETVTFSATDDRAAAAGTKGAVQVWSASTGWEPIPLKDKTHKHTVTFSPFGDLCVVLNVVPDNFPGIIKGSDQQFWNLDSGQRITHFPHDNSVVATEFTSTGDRLFTTDGGSIKVWNVRSGKEIKSIEPKNRYGGGIKEMAISPAEDRMVTVHWNGSVSLWDLDHIMELDRFAHEDHIIDISFGSNNDVLATGGKDGTVRIWELETMKEIARLSHDAEVKAVAFDPKSDRLAIASGKSVRIWNWQFEDLIDEVCSRIPRNFTMQEWRLYMDDETYRPTCPNLASDTLRTRISRGIRAVRNNIKNGTNITDESLVHWPK